MKNMKLATLTLVLSAFSSASYAIVDGTSTNWADHDNMVNSSCTGLVIGGDFILTAAHCTDIQEPVNFSNGAVVEITNRVNHPDYAALGLADVAIFTLSDTPNVERIDFLNPRDLVTDEDVKTYGFGGTGNDLHYATLRTDSATDSANNGAPYPNVTLRNIGLGYLIGGDSGGTGLDNNGFVITLNNGVNGNINIATVLKVAKDFITSTVNDWHYPTIVKTTSGNTQVVKIQSLHTSPTDILNTINTTGDASIDTAGITCASPSGVVSSPSAVNPYDVCSLPLTSNGDEGKIVLGNDAVITVNKKAEVKPDPKPQPDNGGGGGGGSLGWTALFGLLFAGFVRRTR